jgi:hypothetical protein
VKNVIGMYDSFLAALMHFEIKHFNMQSFCEKSGYVAKVTAINKYCFDFPTQFFKLDDNYFCILYIR